MKVLVSLAACLAMLIPSLLLAEEAGLLLEIEEVIVTAQKREQDISEIPSTVQAIEGEKLEIDGTSDIMGLLREIPSATRANHLGGGAFNVVHMRGSGGLGQTGDGAVAFYLDEVPFVVPNNQFSPVANMYDLDRMEILRGPQGTIWGQGSMGGTIRYQLNQPDLSGFSAKARLSYRSMEGGSDGHGLDVAVNLPLAENVFGIRFSGGIETRAGWAEAPDVDDQDLNEEELSNWRVKALWQPSDTIEVSATYWHMEVDTDYSHALQSVDPPMLPPTGGQQGFMSGESDVFSVTLDIGFDDFDLVSTTTYLDHSVPLLIPFFAPAAGTVLATQNYESETFAQEVRLVSSGNTDIDWILGAHYSTTEHFQRQDSFFFNSFIQSLVGTDSSQDIESDAYAFFGEASIDLMDGKLVPLVGLRYFEDERSLVDNSIRARGIDASAFGTCDEALLLMFVGFPLRCETRLPTFETSNTFDSLNPRFNLSYFPNEDGMFYINIAKGFRSGYLQTLAAVQAASFDGVTASQALDADSVLSYEVGGKWRLLDNRMYVEFALYRAEYQDAQVLYGTTIAIPVGVHGGDYQADGVELSVTFRPIEGLTLSGVYSAVSSEWTKVDPVLEQAVPAIDDGGGVPYIPESDWNVSATYTGPIAGTGLQHFEQLSYAERDTQFNYSLNESEKLEDLTLRVGVLGNGWQVYLYGTNLSDNRGPVLSLGSTQTSQRPREIGVSVHFHLN